MFEKLRKMSTRSKLAVAATSLALVVAGHQWLFAQSIVLTSPTDYTVFQRNSSDQADFAIAGTYTGSPAAIEARFNGGEWVVIDAAPSGGAFSGTLPVRGVPTVNAQGALEVRFSNDQAITDSANFVGIGDIYICAGQSNMSGRGASNQSYSHATLKACLFGNDYAWKELSDPYDDSTNQVDSVSDDAGGEGGSFIPLLATCIMDHTGYPVAFVPCSKGGTSANDWQPHVVSQDRSTLYGSMDYRISRVGGAKAVLWWQGERDAKLGTSQAAYESQMQAILDGIKSDWGIPVCVAKIHDGPYAEADVWAAVKSLWAESPGPDFSNCVTHPDNIHFSTNAELELAALLWSRALGVD